MKTIYFVRHGQSQANVDGIFAGCRIDSPLTDVGRRQAELTADALQGKTFDLIVSSPLLRAKTTAECLAKRLGYSGKIILEPLLRERDFGDATGVEYYSPTVAEIDNEMVHGLETMKQLAERMQQVLERFRSLPGESILVVGHGTAETMLQTIYQGRSYDTFEQTKELDNAAVREYQIAA